MRTSLFISSLFAVSLVGGAAFADNHHTDRTHGDQVDKNYVAHTQSSHAGSAASTQARTQAPSSVSKAGDSRINCSADSADCGSSSRGSSSHSVQPAQGAAGKTAFKNPLEKQGDERVNCNEGDECSASSKGMKAVWAKSRGSSNGGESAAMTKAAATANRLMDQANSARMECNEGEECSFSSKAAKKIWRTEAFKHGTVGATTKADEVGNSFQALKEKMEHARYATKDMDKTKKQH